MIVEWAMALVDGLIKVIFSLLGVLPDMPEKATSVVDGFFDLIFDGVEIVNFFVPLDFVSVLIPIIIVIMNFEKVYKLIMWVLRKIPFISVE